MNYKKIVILPFLSMILSGCFRGNVSSSESASSSETISSSLIPSSSEISSSSEIPSSSEISSSSEIPSSSESPSSSEASYVSESSEPSSESEEKVPVKPGLSLKWHDEFSGTSLNTNNWKAVVGDGAPNVGFGNNEQQYYTDREENVRIADGNLVITARKEKYSAESRSEYTSAKMRTAGLVGIQYGYIEASIKLPTVAGLWPAFWMMPEWRSPYGGWPNGGEIDIMEARGRVSSNVSSALHYGGLPEGGGDSTYQSRTYYFENSSIAEYHTYAVRWEAEKIEWFVDDVSYFIMEPASKVNGGWWTATSDSPLAPFDSKFHFILNMAVGGHFDQGILPPQDFIEASMYVDYIRVYDFV